MTIILCPKFNQHNLSGPSSGGMFLLETKKQKKQKAKKRGFIFAWNSRLLCPCIICVLESTERSSTGGQIWVKRNYKLFKFPRTNGVYSQRIYIKIQSEIIISNAVKTDSFLELNWFWAYTALHYLPGSFRSMNDVGHCTVIPFWEHTCRVDNRDLLTHTSEENNESFPIHRKKLWLFLCRFRTLIN